jgi:hypothetical protein
MYLKQMYVCQTITHHAKIIRDTRLSPVPLTAAKIKKGC